MFGDMCLRAAYKFLLRAVASGAVLGVLGLTTLGCGPIAAVALSGGGSSSSRSGGTNAAPSVGLGAVARDVTTVVIPYTLSDPNGDQVDVLVEYSSDGLTWFTATPHGTSEGVVALTAAPTGWDWRVGPLIPITA